MPRNPESVVLFSLLGGLGLTTALISFKLVNMEKSIPDAVAEAFWIYRSQIAVLVITIFLLLATAYFFQKSINPVEKISNWTRKVPVEVYERNKQIETEQAVRKLVESEAYKKYLDDKNNNRLKDIQFDEDDQIALSDDSSLPEEETRRQ